MAHQEHVDILCYGAPTTVKSRDYLVVDGVYDFPITHYIGYTRQQPPVKRIRSHGARSAHHIARIQPGTLADEVAIKRHGACPRCRGSLWYFAESPTYPGQPQA
jgi:hypothetical protein